MQKTTPRIGQQNIHETAKARTKDAAIQNALPEPLFPAIRRKTKPVFEGLRPQSGDLHIFPLFLGKYVKISRNKNHRASQTSHFLKRRMPSFPERPRWSSRCGTQQWNPPEPLPAPRKCPGRSLRCPRLRAESPRARYGFHVDKERNLSFYIFLYSLYSYVIYDVKCVYIIVYLYHMHTSAYAWTILQKAQKALIVLIQCR